ncbi:MAG TPA: hypothetical protein V6D48_14395 [Oculatellaceae cyanobacterium]
MSQTVKELAQRFKELIKERDSEFEKEGETSRFEQLNADAEQLVQFISDDQLFEFNQLINQQEVPK